MSISNDDLNTIDATIIKTVERGARSVTSGDKKIDFIDADKLLDVKRRLVEESNGGLYDVSFVPKGYF